MNPAKKARLFREDNGRVRFLTEDDEYPRLIQAASESKTWCLGSIVVLGCHTGLRRRNLLALQWNQVDLRNRVIRIESTEAKGKRTIVLPLNKTTFAELCKLRKVSGEHMYVFAHLEGRYKGQVIRDTKNSFRAAVKRAGIEDFKFHDLRHCFASWLALRGVPLNTIRELTGHSSLKMTLRYTHLSREHTASAVRVLDGIKAA